MDHKFTEQIKQWLETPESERDYAVGALYLLKLSGNQIMYKNIIAQIDRRHDVVDYQLQKYYNFRVQALTHAQVEEKAAQVATIADEHHLADDASTVPEDERRLGKREDHDDLSDEVKGKYVENLSLLQRMRELYLRLHLLSLDNSPCPAQPHATSTVGAPTKCLSPLTRWRRSERTARLWNAPLPPTAS